MNCQKPRNTTKVKSSNYEPSVTPPSQRKWASFRLNSVCSRQQMEKEGSDNGEMAEELNELRAMKQNYEDEQLGARELLEAQTLKIRELEDKYTSEVTFASTLL